METSVFLNRTQAILDDYRYERDPLIALLEADESAAFSRFDLLSRQTIQRLRENKAECVREEQQAATRIVGNTASEDHVDLGYSSIKESIDEAIAEVLADKARLRIYQPNLDVAIQSDRRAQSAPLTTELAESSATNAIEKLKQLSELHRSGVLSDAEFATATARILDDH